MLDVAAAPTDHASDDPARVPDAYAALVGEIGEDGAEEVRSVFWSETEMRLDLFGRLDFDTHRARIAREAHSLKSAAATFGYLRLARLARRLETAAETLMDDDFRKLREQMRSAYLAARTQEPHA